MKIFFKIVYYLFLTAIGLVAILLLVSATNIPGNFKALTVLSGSMEPAIKTGSVVVIKSSADYKIGDIITFGPMSKTKVPTTHRIVDIKEDNGQQIFITKGDANNAPDAKETAKSEIIGKVLFDLPYLGFAVDVARKPVGFIFIIAIPAAIIVFDEIVKITKEIKRMRRKESGIMNDES